jgi:hypothetical protein
VTAPDKGETEFKTLIGKYPNDGMVYYSRGEGYECLGLLESALADYRTAERLMPAPHWREVAKLAADRVQQKRVSLRYRSPNPVWEAFHRIYGASTIPHRVRVDALSAVARFEAEPHLSAAALRSCLEDLVLGLLKETSAHCAEKNLEDRIDLLRSLGLVSPELATKMHKLRDLGNKAVHPELRVGVDFSPVLRYFSEIAESAFQTRSKN